ncbi:hypothetical protein COY44_01460, partial [Candidatus Berkelbacteria bacterium CG_4_10_14_0_8_um_filter_39_42]
KTNYSIMKKYIILVISSAVLLVAVYVATLFIPQRPSVESEYNNNAIQSFENADLGDELAPPVPEF